MASDTQREPTATPIDPVTANVIQGALQSIAIEMGWKLMRMSYSSIIRESEDFGTAICDAKGRQLCESVQSTPLQSGPIPGYVAGVREILETRGESLAPGDVILHNSAYHGASHAPDLGFIVPVFVDDDLVGYAVTTAHHLDVGSHLPGSVGIVDAMDAYAESLQFKALKVYEKGVRNDAVWDFIGDNVRIPGLVVGDMEAQVAAARIGAGRFVELIGRYGLNTVNAAADALLDYSERMLRQAISALPDGRYQAEGHIDGFLDDPERRGLRIAVTVTVTGDELLVDFTGTDPQIDDRPLNMPFVGTVDVAVWHTVRSILLDSDSHGHVPQNSGLARPITITAPLGTLVNPIFPAPTIARAVPGNLVADTIMHALAEAVPGQVSAGVGNLRAISFAGIKEGQHWVHIDIHEGSYGGRPGKDGMDAVDTLYANTRNNPIEDIESHLPVRVLRYELRNEACAAGRWRGGIGSEREIEFLEDAFVAIEGDGHAYAPWGFRGGAAGFTSRITRLTRAGETIEWPSMMPSGRVRQGERVAMTGTSGGGYGDPLSRPAAAIAEDVRDGYVTIAEAKSDYGVVLKGDLTVDKAATAQERTGRGA
jgi:N-methylhydantoinase B